MCMALYNEYEKRSLPQVVYNLDIETREATGEEMKIEAAEDYCRNVHLCLVTTGHGD